MSSSAEPQHCRLCLQHRSDSVTVPCGHSLCRGCLSERWSRGSNCPVCGTPFNPTLALTTNPAPRGLVQDLCPVSVDPFSAHQELSLSERNRVVCRRGELHSYPDHQERFDGWTQALSHEGLRGRSYWEAEWEGVQVAVGVSYHSIGRKGTTDVSRLGHNAQSWCLKCSASSFSFCHGAREQQVVVQESAVSRRIGVFVDVDRGLLCFLAVRGTRLHLPHRLEHHFTQPLYVAVWIGSRSSVSFCHKN